MPRVYISTEGTSRHSIACLALILASCPILSSIHGSFDLSPGNISQLEDITPHTRIREIDLGTSYFSEGEPQEPGWPSAIVYYLAKLSHHPFDISLSKFICTPSGGADELDPGDWVRRQESGLLLFDECVRLANLMKQ